MLQALDAPTVVSQKVTVSGESNAIINVETTQNITDVFIDYATRAIRFIANTNRILAFNASPRKK